MLDFEYIDFKQKLKEANDIVDVISSYITLTQRGKNMWACCPFHHEKTPSFAINTYEQYYHCFGCGESGDVITFIMKYENVSYNEAIEILCNRANMQMPKDINDDNAKLIKEKRTHVFEANKLAAKYYYSNLQKAESKVAVNYLKNRNIDNNSIVRFGLGYSTGWTGLIDELQSKGITVDVMREAGLVSIKNGRAYDRMANRLMFPLINAFGDVVGFSGRILTQEKTAKYINTEQTVVFDKSKVIYGINLIKKLFQQAKIEYILLVEGQIDVISLHQAGFTTAVATLGTALTPFHARELSRYSNKIVVCFDGDSAGQKAALRSLDILKDSFYITVVSIPNNMDPDEFIKANGKDAFKKLIDEALPLMDYKLQRIAQSYNLDNKYEKTKYIQEALNVIREIKSTAESEIYLKVIAETAKVSIDNLNRELAIMPKQENKVIEKEEHNMNNIESSPNAYVDASRFILSSLLNKKEYAYFDDELEFLNGSLQKLYNEMLSLNKQNKQFIISNIFDLFNVTEEPEITALLNYKLTLNDEMAKQYYIASINTVKMAKIDSQLTQLKQLYDTEQDLDKKLEIAKQIQALSKVKRM